jgi:hypothetical protein
MKKKIIIILAIVLIIFMVGFIFKSGDKKGDIVIKFTEIKRGDIKNLVSSTGTIIKLLLRLQLMTQKQEWSGQRQYYPRQKQRSGGTGLSLRRGIFLKWNSL